MSGATAGRFHDIHYGRAAPRGSLTVTGGTVATRAGPLPADLVIEDGRFAAARHGQVVQVHCEEGELIDGLAAGAIFRLRARPAPRPPRREQKAPACPAR